MCPPVYLGVTLEMDLRTIDHVPSPPPSLKCRLGLGESANHFSASTGRQRCLMRHFPRSVIDRPSGAREPYSEKNRRRNPVTCSVHPLLSALPGSSNTHASLKTENRPLAQMHGNIFMIIQMILHNITSAVFINIHVHCANHCVISQEGVPL